ncbi:MULTISPECIES: hypothetical protein [unclassified Rhizobium]|uniref:hypothetical protein n=1 Tax=unclassified Rhizobium TaxID=2613769 RepID=UPI001AD98F51|nr:MULTISPECIES: hypothetical protein [unclassified Rhizobium]MBO9127853.1 hypothetical protein [Rhizobium sp. 16-488-2b]MBO9175141.1 hypothetical protein [Rhizobium sp. 16-488-2a]
MADALPFEQMTIGERTAVLTSLAQHLQITAAIAQHDGDPIWKFMSELAVRLEGSRDEVAADPQRGNEVVGKAVRLLSEFELRRPRGTIH